MWTLTRRFGPDSRAFWRTTVAIYTAIEVVLLCLGLGSLVGRPYPTDQTRESLFTLYLLMSAPGFPTAPVLATWISALCEYWGMEFFSVANGPIGFGVTWIVMFVLGFLQWFIFVPFLIYLFSKNRKSSVPPSHKG